MCVCVCIFSLFFSLFKLDCIWWHFHIFYIISSLSHTHCVVSFIIIIFHSYFSDFVFISDQQQKEKKTIEMRENWKLLGNISLHMECLYVNCVLLSFLLLLFLISVDRNQSRKKNCLKKSMFFKI